ALRPAEGAAPPRGVLGVRLAPEVWLFGAAYFGLTLCNYALGLWLPQMIKAAGVASASAALVTAAPYALGAAGMLAWGRFVDRRGAARASSVWLPAFAAAAGLAASAYVAWPLQL